MPDAAAELYIVVGATDEASATLGEIANAFAVWADKIKATTATVNTSLDSVSAQGMSALAGSIQRASEQFDLFIKEFEGLSTSSKELGDNLKGAAVPMAALGDVAEGASTAVTNSLAKMTASVTSAGTKIVGVSQDIYKAFQFKTGAIGINTYGDYLVGALEDEANKMAAASTKIETVTARYIALKQELSRVTQDSLYTSAPALRSMQTQFAGGQMSAVEYLDEVTKQQQDMIAKGMDIGTVQWNQYEKARIEAEKAADSEIVATRKAMEAELLAATKTEFDGEAAYNEMFAAAARKTFAAGWSVTNPITGAEGAASRLKSKPSASHSMVSGWTGLFVGAMAVAPLIGAAKAAGEFEALLTKIQATAGDPTPLETLRRQIQAVSTAYGQMPNDVAISRYTIASAGYHGQQGYQVSNLIGQFARGTQTSMPDSTNLIIKTMKAYQQTGDALQNATKDANIYTVAISRSLVPGAEFAPAMAQILASGKTAGISIQQLAAALDLMTQQTKNALRGSTYLRNMLLGLAHPTSTMREGFTAAAGALKDAGDKQDAYVLSLIATGDGQKALSDASIGIPGVFKAITAAVQGNAGALGRLFPDMRKVQAAAILSGTDYHTYAGILNDVDKANQKNADGQTALGEALRHQRQPLGDISADYTNLAIDLGQQMLPMLTQLADAIKGITTWFLSLSNAMQSAIVQGALYVGGIAVLVSALRLVRGSIEAVIQFFGLLKGAEAAAAVEGAVGFAVTGPWGIAIAAAALLVLAIVDAWNSAKKAQADYYNAQHTGTASVDIVAHVSQAKDALNAAKSDLSPADFDSTGTLLSSVSNIPSTAEEYPQVQAYKSALDAYNAAALTQEKFNAGDTNFFVERAASWKKFRDANEAKLTELLARQQQVVSKYIVPGSATSESDIIAESRTPFSGMSDIRSISNQVDALRNRIALENNGIRWANELASGIPGGGGSTVTSGMSATIAKYFDNEKIAKDAKNCEQRIREGIQSATHILDPFFKGSAAETIAALNGSGLLHAYTPGMPLKPGDVLYSNTLGNGEGHASGIDSHGNRVDQYGRNRFPMSDYQYYLDPSEAAATLNQAGPGRKLLYPHIKKWWGTTTTGKGHAPAASESLPLEQRFINGILARFGANQQPTGSLAGSTTVSNYGSQMNAAVAQTNNALAQFDQNAQDSNDNLSEMDQRFQTIKRNIISINGLMQQRLIAQKAIVEGNAEELADKQKLDALEKSALTMAKVRGAAQNRIDAVHAAGGKVPKQMLDAAAEANQRLLDINQKMSQTSQAHQKAVAVVTEAYKAQNDLKKSQNSLEQSNLNIQIATTEEVKKQNAYSARATADTVRSILEHAHPAANEYAQRQNDAMSTYVAQIVALSQSGTEHAADMPGVSDLVGSFNGQNLSTIVSGLQGIRKPLLGAAKGSEGYDNLLYLNQLLSDLAKTATAARTQYDQTISGIEKAQATANQVTLFQNNKQAVDQFSEALGELKNQYDEGTTSLQNYLNGLEASRAALKTAYQTFKGQGDFTAADQAAVLYNSIGSSMVGAVNKANEEALKVAQEGAKHIAETFTSSLVDGLSKHKGIGEAIRGMLKNEAVLGLKTMLAKSLETIILRVHPPKKIGAPIGTTDVLTIAAGDFAGATGQFNAGVNVFASVISAFIGAITGKASPAFTAAPGGGRASGTSAALSGAPGGIIGTISDVTKSIGTAIGTTTQRAVASMPAPLSSAWFGQLTDFSKSSALSPAGTASAAAGGINAVTSLATQLGIHPSSGGTIQSLQQGAGAVRSVVSLGQNALKLAGAASSGLGASLSAAIPYLGLVTSIIGLAGIFGNHNSTPSRIGKEVIAPALREFSTSKSSYAGLSGLRNVLGIESMGSAGIRGVGAAPTAPTYQITIHPGAIAIHGSSSPEATANEVMNRIASETMLQTLTRGTKRT